MPKKKWKWKNPAVNSEYDGLYKSWHDMLRRAGNKDGKNPSYSDVSVCERWLSYDNFFEDMVDTWWKGASIDKDTIKPGNRVYCKEYCKWVSKSENSIERNKRVVKKSSGRKPIYKVKCIETNTIYSNIEEANKIFNFSHDTIGKVCRGERETAGNYHWEYVKEE